MNRLARLDENRLEEDIAALERDLEELKAAAQVMNVIWFASQLAGDYDWQDTIPDPGGLGFGGKLFLVEAEAANMDVLWAALFVDLYTGTPPVLYTAADALTDMAAGNDYFLTYVTDVPNAASSASTKSWYVNVTGSTTPTLSVKVRVEGLDQAAITITELN